MSSEIFAIKGIFAFLHCSAVNKILHETFIGISDLAFHVALPLHGFLLCLALKTFLMESLVDFILKSALHKNFLPHKTVWFIHYLPLSHLPSLPHVVLIGFFLG